MFTNLNLTKNRQRTRIAAVFACLCLAAAQGHAQDAPTLPKPVPYDSELAKLAEKLGALHFLRNLCSASPEDQWRALMNELLQTETGDEPERRARLTAAFNRGYRSFAAVHNTCTVETREIAEKYRVEGATLAAEITARFGN